MNIGLETHDVLCNAFDNDYKIYTTLTPNQHYFRKNIILFSHFNVDIFLKNKNHILCLMIIILIVIMIMCALIYIYMYLFIYNK